MKLIDKDALVTKIDDWRHNITMGIVTIPLCGHQRADATLEYEISGRVKDFVNSLEVKEVDLETSIDDYINLHFTEGCDGGMISDWYKVLGGVHYNDLKEIAKHFFELGLKVQKGE